DILPDAVLRPFERVVVLNLHCDRPLPPQYLAWLQQFTHLEQLNLYGHFSLADVSDFAQLRTIEIRGGRGGHQVPPHPLRLKNLPRLETAKIVEVPVTQLDIVNVPRLRLLHV